jgi:hypothetical protein
VDTELGSDSSASLARLTEQQRALAAVGFVQRDAQAALEVWLVDRATGKASMHRLDAGRGADAASVIAVRAVDLLRTSLGEFSAGDLSATDRVAAKPAAVPEAARQHTADSAPRFWLSAAGILLRASDRLGFSGGPTLALFYRANSWFHLGVCIAGPLAGAKLHTLRGDASLRQESAWLEVRLVIVQLGRIQVAPLIGVGGYFLQAQGQPMPPLVKQNDQVWSWLASVGAHVELALFSQLSAVLSLRALAMLPRVGVAVLKDSERVDLPALEASLGVAVGL